MVQGAASLGEEIASFMCELALAHVYCIPPPNRVLEPCYFSAFIWAVCDLHNCTVQVKSPPLDFL